MFSTHYNARFSCTWFKFLYSEYDKFFPLKMIIPLRSQHIPGWKATTWKRLTATQEILFAKMSRQMASVSFRHKTGASSSLAPMSCVQLFQPKANFISGKLYIYQHKGSKMSKERECDVGIFTYTTNFLADGNIH
jgi:hypothetical protein